MHSLTPPEVSCHRPTGASQEGPGAQPGPQRAQTGQSQLGAPGSWHPSPTVPSLTLSLVFQPGSGARGPPSHWLLFPCPVPIVASPLVTWTAQTRPLPTSPDGAAPSGRCWPRAHSAAWEAGWPEPAPLWAALSLPAQSPAPGVHGGRAATSTRLTEQRGPRASARHRGSFQKATGAGDLQPRGQERGRDTLSQPSVPRLFLPVPGLQGTPQASWARVAAKPVGSVSFLQVPPPDKPESDLPAARKPSKDPGSVGVPEGRAPLTSRPDRPVGGSTQAHPGLGSLVSMEMRSGIRGRR